MALQLLRKFIAKKGRVDDRNFGHGEVDFFEDPF